MRIRPAAAHLFVGADAHIGPTECTIFTMIFGEFAASQRADAHIGPTECTIFTKIFGEFAASQRADVGIGPYTEMGRCIRV